MSNDTVLKVCQMLESAGQSNDFVGDMFSGEGCDSMQEEYDRFKGYGQEHSEEDEDRNELDLIRDLMSLGVTAMKAKDNYGGEGQGDDYWAVVEVHFGFTSKVAYIKLSGWYASHYGSELEEVYRVSPRIVEKTEWERSS